MAFFRDNGAALQGLLPVSIVSVPFHLGTRDVVMGRGPTALIEEHEIAAALGGEVAVETASAPSNSDLPEIGRTFDVARAVSGLVGAARAAGRLPLVLAGNCNSCLGTVAGLAPAEPGVVWFDAHADFDTPEDNASGFLDVMALSTLTGRCWETLRRSIPGFREVPEEDVVMVAVRDLEPYQRESLERSEVRSVPDGRSLESALDDLRGRRDGVYLHVDMDCIDPSEGRANQYAAPGGLTVGELEDAIAAVGTRFRIEAAAITAYDPSCDEDGRIGRAAVRVAQAIVAAASR